MNSLLLLSLLAASVWAASNPYARVDSEAVEVRSPQEFAVAVREKLISPGLLPEIASAMEHGEFPNKASHLEFFKDGRCPRISAQSLMTLLSRVTWFAFLAWDCFLSRWLAPRCHSGMDKSSSSF